MLETQDLSSYALYISGTRQPKKEEVETQLGQLHAQKERWGLTRIEALQNIVLEQCGIKQSEAFIRTRASLIHIFESMSMIYQVEQELSSRMQTAANR
mgnify:FL=1